VRRASALGATILAVLALSACGERSEPTEETVPLYPVTVHDASGRAVTLSQEPRRIVTLSPGTAELLAVLGDGGRVVGIPASARRGAAPHAMIVLDKHGVLLPARIAARKPQLVIATPDMPLDQVRRAAAQTHAAVYIAPSNSLHDVERAATDIGLLVDEPIAARGVVSKLETARQRVQRRVRGKSRVSAFVDTGFFTTVSNRSLVGDFLRIARGRNVAGPTPDPEPLDPKELVRLNPRVYIATSDSDATLHSLRKDPSTKRIAAVRNGRFTMIRSRLLEPGPYAGEGLLAIAHALHPDAFR
jgi:iron complex transport system substrate-binding protein